MPGTSPDNDAQRDQRRDTESRLSAALRSFNLRRVPGEKLHGLTTELSPRAGDLVLVRVNSIGQHPRLQLSNGRRAQIYEGSEILLAYAARYATGQFEAEVPEGLGPCSLIAAGGLAGRVLSRAKRMRRPTAITALGLVTDPDGRVLTLADHGLPTKDKVPDPRPLTIAVLGTGMDAGKTTAARHLIRGLVRGGLRVAATKVTGTGACGDFYSMLDAGAEPVYDMVDAGYASTAGIEASELIRCVVTLLGNCYESGVDAVVVEVADGLLQPETQLLLRSDVFADAVDSVLLAAVDALGASAGVEHLRNLRLPCRALVGKVSASNLHIEEARIATGLPVFSSDTLIDPGIISRVLPRVSLSPDEVE